MNANLFVTLSFVLVLLGLLAYTLWYRAHKRNLRKCKCTLEGGRLCGCQPQRIGQIWPILQPAGTHPSIDGEKVLALVLTRCRSTGTIKLAKWEEKYVGRVGRQWKLLTEPRAYNPDIELLLCVRDPVTVVQLLEKVRLADGKDGTSVFGDVAEIPGEMPDYLQDLLTVVLRRRRSRNTKAATTELRPARHRLVPVTAN